jgi:hypothetical protein
MARRAGPGTRRKRAQVRRVLVSHLGLGETGSDATLNLLAVTYEKTEPPAGIIILLSADGALRALTEVQRSRP